MANNGFIKTIFWTLIIGSFGWATAIGGAALVADANTKAKHEKDCTEIRQQINDGLLKQETTNGELKTQMAEGFAKLFAKLDQIEKNGK